MAVAEQRHARAVEAWIAERIEVTAELLDMPVEDVTPDDVRRCSLLHGRPHQPEPNSPTAS